MGASRASAGQGDFPSGKGIEERPEALDMVRVIEWIADMLKIFWECDDSRIRLGVRKTLVAIVKHQPQVFFSELAAGQPFLVERGKTFWITGSHV